MSDNGSEFVGRDFQDMLEKRGIVHQTALVGDHHALGIVDRMTLTLKNYLYKQFIGEDNLRWVSRLSFVIDSYNNTPHSGLYGYTPNEAYENKTARTVLTTINLELMKNRRILNKAKEGDSVRTRVPEGVFKRGFTPKWSTEVKEVSSVRGNTVYVEGKPFKAIDIQVVKNDGLKVGTKYEKAVKEDKVKRAIRKEGVDKAEEGLGDARLIGKNIRRKVDGKFYNAKVVSFLEPYYKVKYEAMRKVLLATLPDSEPGVTYDEMKAAILPHLSEELWPGGEKVGWWLKAVHLDLEAKGIMRRIVVKPLRYLKSQEPH
jgi:hypothetical protein